MWNEEAFDQTRNVADSVRNRTGLNRMAATTLARSSPRTSGSPVAHKRGRFSGLGWALLRWTTIGLALAVTVVPFFWLVSTSFKRQVDYLAYPPQIIPPAWTPASKPSVGFEALGPLPDPALISRSLAVSAA